MKCPNCQTENPDVAKFCRGCGQKLEAPTPVATPAPAPSVTPQAAPAAEPSIYCKKCGSPLKATAKFCAKCGTPVNDAPKAAPIPPQAAPTAPKAAPVPPQVAPAAPKAAPVPPQAAPTAPKAAPIPPQVAPTAPKAAPIPPQVAPAAPAAPKKKGAPVALIIVCALIVVIALAIVILIKLDIIGGSDSDSDSKTGQNVEETVTEESAESEETAEGEEAATEASDELSEEELAKIMAPVDVLKDEGIALLESDNLSEGISKLTTAMQQYVSVLQAHGAQPALTENINNAYTAYASGVINHVNILYEQELSAGIYEQMSKELTESVDLAYTLAENGCVVDSTILESTLADLPSIYKEKYILQFNTFTEREQWSRSECWGLMEDVPEMNLYDPADKNDPLRLRYAYALAMITRKNNDNALADGSKTARDLGKEILDNIEEMDYHPLLIQDAANYYKQAGDNYTAQVLYALYDDLLSRIEAYQGIRIPNDVPIERFWYFNDFGTYSVDPTNGATTECREEIRTYASDILSSL